MQQGFLESRARVRPPLEQRQFRTVATVTWRGRSLRMHAPRLRRVMWLDDIGEMTMATTLSPEDAAQLRTYERQRHRRAGGRLYRVLRAGHGARHRAAARGGAAAARHEAARCADAARARSRPKRRAAVRSVIGVDISSGMIAQAQEAASRHRLPRRRRRAPAGRGWRARRRRMRLRHRAFPLPGGLRRRMHAHAEAGRARSRSPGGTLPTSSASKGSIRDAVAEVGAKPPPVLPAGHSSLRFTDVDEFRRLLDGAGLADITLQDHRATHLVPDVDALWNGALGGLRSRPR